MYRSVVSRSWRQYLSIGTWVRRVVADRSSPLVESYLLAIRSTTPSAHLIYKPAKFCGKQICLRLAHRYPLLIQRTVSNTWLFLQVVTPCMGRRWVIP